MWKCISRRTHVNSVKQQTSSIFIRKIGSFEHKHYFLCNSYNSNAKRFCLFIYLAFSPPRLSPAHLFLFRASFFFFLNDLTVNYKSCHDYCKQLCVIFNETLHCDVSVPFLACGDNLFAKHNEGKRGKRERWKLWDHSGLFWWLNMFSAVVFPTSS